MLQRFVCRPLAKLQVMMSKNARALCGRKLACDQAAFLAEGVHYYKFALNAELRHNVRSNGFQFQKHMGIGLHAHHRITHQTEQDSLAE